MAVGIPALGPASAQESRGDGLDIRAGIAAAIGCDAGDGVEQRPPAQVEGVFRAIDRGTGQRGAAVADRGCQDRLQTHALRPRCREIGDGLGSRPESGKRCTLMSTQPTRPAGGLQVAIGDTTCQPRARVAEASASVARRSTTADVHLTLTLDAEARRVVQRLGFKQRLGDGLHR